jgi:hypothetical protein
MLNLPENARIFTESVINDCRQLINLGIWEIQMSRFEGWIRQFCGEEEEYFSACLLYQLIFRSTPQFDAGLNSLFRSNLNGTLKPYSMDMEFIYAIRGRMDPKIRLIPVICESDPPTKSGPLVLRRIKRTLDVRDQWMCWPWQSNDAEISTIIFVDDFLGSGKQFLNFFKKWEFDKISSNVQFIYVPVMAHRQGIDFIKTELPQVIVTAAEILESSHSFFSEDAWLELSQGSISAEDAKNWYSDFATRKQLCPHSTGCLGTGDIAITVGFSHGTPNNTLPIFWYSNQNWQPILER